MKERLKAEEARAIAKIQAEQLQKKIREEEADKKNLHLVQTCVNAYAETMRSRLQPHAYLSDADLRNVHQQAKRDAKSKVCSAAKSV